MNYNFTVPNNEEIERNLWKQIQIIFIM
jgi:hypothetical protein